jgi:hypothetical protein
LLRYTLYIFRAGIRRIKVTCDREIAMHCLVPRDPTHLAACRRWPALSEVSALCVRCGIDTTLLCLCAAGDSYRLRNHRAGTVSKGRTSLHDNPAHGDSDDVKSVLYTAPNKMVQKKCNKNGLERSKSWRHYSSIQHVNSEIYNSPPPSHLSR